MKVKGIREDLKRKIDRRKKKGKGEGYSGGRSKRCIPMEDANTANRERKTNVCRIAQGSRSDYEVRWKKIFNNYFKLSCTCCQAKGETVNTCTHTLSSAHPISAESIGECGTQGNLVKIVEI